MFGRSRGVIVQKGHFKPEGSEGGTRRSELPNQDACRREASAGHGGGDPSGLKGFERGSPRSHESSSAGERQGETQGETEHSGSPWTAESQRQEMPGAGAPGMERRRLWSG